MVAFGFEIVNLSERRWEMKKMCGGIEEEEDIFVNSFLLLFISLTYYVLSWTHLPLQRKEIKEDEVHVQN